MYQALVTFFAKKTKWKKRVFCKFYFLFNFLWQFVGVRNVSKLMVKGLEKLHPVFFHSSTRTLFTLSAQMQQANNFTIIQFFKFDINCFAVVYNHLNKADVNYRYNYKSKFIFLNQQAKL